MRLTSLVLTITILASALVYLGNENKGKAAAAETNDKTYMEYIVKRLTNGMQDKFRVLEIVPYEGCGDFEDYKTIFIENVMTEYKYLISERMEVNTVVAKNLTAENISDADLIIINTGVYNGDAASNTFYTQDGTAINASDLGSYNIYNTFEQVPADSVPSDEDEAITYGSIYFKDENEWGNVYVGWTADYSPEVPKHTNLMTLVGDGVYVIENVPSDAKYITFSNGTDQIQVSIRFDSFNKIFYSGAWCDYPLLINPNTYTVILPAEDSNIVAEGVASATEGKEYKVKLSAADGYVLPETIAVKIAETDYTGFTYNNVTGEVTIPAEGVVGEITIIATAVSADTVTYYTVTMPEASTNLVCVGDTSAIANRVYSAALSAVEGYVLPDTITVTIGGNAYTGFTYDKTTGQVKIPAEAVVGDIKINGTALSSAGRVAYVTRDMSWATCESLLDYIINGRNIKLPDGTTVANVQTPVMFNTSGINTLNKDSNIYKMLFVYRSCDANSWNALKEKLSTRQANRVKYKNTTGAATVAITKELTGLAQDAVSWEAGADNPLTKLFNNMVASGYEGDLSGYNANKLKVKPGGEVENDDDLTNAYWAYSSDAWFTSATTKVDIKPNEAAFKGKTGKNNDITAVDVLKYLLGLKSIYYIDMKLRVLEIQPSTSFDYDNITKIRELGTAFLIKGAGTWTESNYKNYISIDYMTTSALNSIKDDIVSNYDVVIIGENTDKLTKKDGKTIYNDRNLNGYVYLAFGDLYKVSSNMLGYLPDEYIELTNDQSKSGGNLRKDEEGHTIRNISDTTIWRGYLQSALTAKKTKSGYFIIYDMYKYYVTKVSERDLNGQKLANNSGKINNESWYMDYYIGNTRLPDNDITTITKNKLVEFVKSGKPVIVSNSVYTADRTVIYPSSDMYDFAKNTLGKLNGSNREYKNVINMTDISRAVGYLGTTAPKIVFSTGNVEVWTRTGTNTFTKSTKSGMQIKPVEPTYDSNDIVNRFNTNKLKFEFTLYGQKNTKYRINFLVDKNNDGVYTKDAASEEKNELFYSNVETLDNTGETLYRITTELADDYLGLIGWKIEIVQLDANNNEETKYKVEETGFSVIYSQTEEKEIKVLQISPGNRKLSQSITVKPVGSPTNVSFSSGTAINVVTGEITKSGTKYTLNITNDIISKTKIDNENMLLTDGDFTNLLSAIQTTVGYKTTITVLTVEEFQAQYVGSKYNRDVLGEGYGSSRDKLSDYDMVVVGFADSFNGKDISNDNGAVDNLADYIDDGKALLLTHDTLSWRSSPNYVAGYVDDDGSSNFSYTGGYKSLVFTDENGNQKQFSGYYMGNTSPTLTFMLREKVGMDRYGVTLNPEDRTDRDIPTYEAVDATDTDYKPSYQTSNEVRELQGFNNWILWREPFTFRHMNNQNGKGDNYYTLRPFDDSTYLYYNKNQNTTTTEMTNNWMTDKVVCLNEGAVTMYPYNIGETITINGTHGQYFELDMEDEEVVVWYALTTTTNTYDNYDKRSQFYGATEGDGANNYYIYSKGNITYSGAGHAKLTNQAKEFKLFANTIIKAIAGGNSKPVIKVVNGSPVAGEYVVYVNSSQTAGQYEIQFQVTDADLISASAADYNVDLVGGLTVAEIYWIKPDGTEVKIKSSGYQAKTKTGEIVITEKLKNGMVQNLTLSDTSLDAASLTAIENSVEEGSRIGARFRIYVEDGLGAKESVVVNLKVRDLFDMN